MVKLLNVCLLVILVSLVSFSIGRIYHKNSSLCKTPWQLNLDFSIREFVGLLTYRSQHEQDNWLLQCIYPKVKNGYFVDVGSGDGILMSNTKTLEDVGWNGICIDPFPENMSSRRCKIFKETVYSKPGEIISFKKARGLGGIDKHLDTWKDHWAVKKATVVEFSTTTLDKILTSAAAPSFIHYMSLDIEGAELEALKGFPFSRYKVGVFTIEHNFEEPKRSEIRKLLEANGYRLSKTLKNDDFYTLDET